MALQLEQRAETEVKRHIITLDEYDRMCEAGVFDPEARIELIRGEIVDMPPAGPEHQYSVSYLNTYFVRLVGDDATVWPQGNSIGLPGTHSRPEPDVTIVRGIVERYDGIQPTVEDVILVVEVSFSTLSSDRKEKGTLYAEVGIPEYWIANLVEGVVEMYTDPAEGKYQSTRIAGRGETLQLPGGIEGSLPVDKILGKAKG